jgi:hypothetical protein
MANCVCGVAVGLADGADGDCSRGKSCADEFDTTGSGAEWGKSLVSVRL